MRRLMLTPAQRQLNYSVIWAEQVNKTWFHHKITMKLSKARPYAQLLPFHSLEVTSSMRWTRITWTLPWNARWINVFHTRQALDASITICGHLASVIVAVLPRLKHQTSVIMFNFAKMMQHLSSWLKATQTNLTTAAWSDLQEMGISSMVHTTRTKSSGHVQTMISATEHSWRTDRMHTFQQQHFPTWWAAGAQDLSNLIQQLARTTAAVLMDVPIQMLH